MHYYITIGCILAALAACAPKEPAEPEDPSSDIVGQYDFASDRLLGMLDRGMVVSRWESGEAEHQGDSLIWSGIAMAALSCEDGLVIEDTLLAMMAELGGGMARHHDRMEKISIDGAIGAYRGIGERIARCPGSAEKWGPMLQAHLANETLNPHTDVTWPLEFRYVPELLLAVAIGGARPDARRLVDLAAQIETWALAVVASKAACYRINLGYQALRTVERAGEAIPPSRRANFCTVTRGTRLPTVESWCGRAPIREWIGEFQYNQWEYRPQRCIAWESPDGKPGLSTPAVDLLEAYRDAYTLAP